MDFEKILKRNQRIKPQKDSEKSAGEGTPSKTKEFWFRGAEFVDIQKFIERLRRELSADGSERRQGWTMRDLSQYPRMEWEVEAPRIPNGPLGVPDRSSWVQGAPGFPDSPNGTGRDVGRMSDGETSFSTSGGRTEGLADVSLWSPRSVASRE